MPALRPLLLAALLHGAAHAAPTAWITNQGDHSVSVVDLATQRVSATVPVAKAPAGCSSPRPATTRCR